MELSHDDVLEILDLIDRTDVEYLELEVDGTRIVADRTGAHMQPSRTGPADPAPPPASAAPEPVPDPVAAPAVAAGPQPAPVDPELATIDAPVVGVFYRSPEPGAPPFVEVGASVETDSTVGLVEVMKMFNSVTAGVRGRVVEILVGNEEFVEFGQPLMTIRPEEAS